MEKETTRPLHAERHVVISLYSSSLADREVAPIVAGKCWMRTSNFIAWSDGMGQQTTRSLRIQTHIAITPHSSSLVVCKAASFYIALMC